MRLCAAHRGGPAAFDVRAEPLGGEVSRPARSTGRRGWGSPRTAAHAVSRWVLCSKTWKGGSAALSRWNTSGTGFEVALHDVAGEVGGRPVSGRAHARGAGRDWSVDLFEFALGDNSGVFRGSSSGEVLALAGRIDAPALAQLGLGVDGALAAELDVAGRWPAAMEGSLQISATAIEAAGFELDGLQASGALEGVL